MGKYPFRGSAALLGTIFLLVSRWVSAQEPKIEHVAHFMRDQPAGIAVTDEGRIFVAFPRHTGKVDFTVGEVRKGKTTAFPSAEANEPRPDQTARTLFSVQSLVVDGYNRLWMLDTGVMKVGEPPLDGAPKLTVVDLATNKIIRTYPIPRDALVTRSSLKDFRLDFSRSAGGTAFITDSAPGSEGLIVFDLGSGKAMRRLVGSPVVGPGAGDPPVVEGKQLFVRRKNGEPKPFAVGLNGIELSLDGKTLYLNAFTRRHLYSVGTRESEDTSISDSDLIKQVRDLGEMSVAGHLSIDAGGRLYAVDIEHNAILRRAPESGGRFVELASGSEMVWPDTMAIGPDDKLYVTSSQHDRGPLFNEGADQRKRPFVLYRIAIGAGPVRAGAHNP